MSTAEFPGGGFSSGRAYLGRLELISLSHTQARAYGYDNASRLNLVSSGTSAATYSYLANSPLVSQISSTNSGTERMVATKSYDNLNRLQSISSVLFGASAVSFSYGLNSGNQRVRSTLGDGSYWVYEYDSLGQVKSGKGYWADGTPVAGQLCAGHNSRALPRGLSNLKLQIPISPPHALSRRGSVTAARAALRPPPLDQFGLACQVRLDAVGCTG